MCWVEIISLQLYDGFLLNVHLILYGDNLFKDDSYRQGLYLVPSYIILKSINRYDI